MKYLLIILIVLSIPLIYADEQSVFYAEEWSVYKNVDNEWIEVKDAKITTDYTISSGGHVMVTKTFINENDEEGIFAFNVKNTFEWDISSKPDTEQPKQFITIIILIGLVTVAGTLLTYLIPQPKKMEKKN